MGDLADRFARGASSFLAALTGAGMRMRGDQLIL